MHTATGGRAVVTVRCPECGKIHRHDLGSLDDPDVRAALQRRWTDEWMACRADLPGNFYRIVFRSSQVKAALPGAKPQPGAAADTPSAPNAPRRRRRKRKKTAPSAVPNP